MIRFPKVFAFDLEVNNASRVDQLTKLSSMSLIDGDCVHTRALGRGIWINNKFSPRADTFPFQVTTKYRNCFTAFAEVVEYMSLTKAVWWVQVPITDEGLAQILPDVDLRWHSANWSGSCVQIVFANESGFLAQQATTFTLKVDNGRKTLYNNPSSIRDCFVEKLRRRKAVVFLSAVDLTLEPDDLAIKVWNLIAANNRESFFKHTQKCHESIYFDNKLITYQKMFVISVSATFENVDQIIEIISSKASKHFHLLESSEDEEYIVNEEEEFVEVERKRSQEAAFNERCFWKKPNLRLSSSECALAYKIYWCRRTMLDAYVCFPEVPPYVMLEILDWLGEVTHMPHVLKIAFLQNIWRSARKVFEARTEKELKAQKTE